MGKKGKIIQPAQAFTDTVPPSNEEIHATITLQLANMKITKDMFEVQEGEWCVYQPSEGVTPDKLAPLYMVVVESSGMVLFFAAAGPRGIHAQVRELRAKKAAAEAAEDASRGLVDGYKTH